MKIFDKKYRGVFSNSVESEVDIDLSTKVRILPNENLEKELSLFSQYNKERDECDKFRLILAINPVCSNVLYNAKTEIVINEGSEDVKVICDCKDGIVAKDRYAPNATNTTGDITYLDAIRNTEYSHPKLGGFKYHCGYDIFNNHLLRNMGYIHINKVAEGANASNYNTILDYMRDGNGDVIKQDVDARYNSKKKDVHLYRHDTLLSMRSAFYERCEERDGWWGFINSMNINLPNRDGNFEDSNTNMVLCDRKPCEFIDLYPDRSLYSFIPKYNKFRNRIENNWDYCITYPYENDYEKINEVCGSSNYSLKANFIKKNNSNGIEVLECSSFIKHNLKVGDRIRLYFINDDNLEKLSNSVQVVSIGDNNGENTDKIFSIKISDVVRIFSILEETNSFFFKRLSNGEECKYYFRKFKKLKNVNGGDLRSEINKIAFGKNIYGDDVAQILFTDDINISGLLDNNGRPVSEVYFTVIKRNSGYNIWYERNINDEGKENNNIDAPKSSSTIEYSHCFGEVTSGLDFSGIKNEPFDYNIHKMHNLNFDSDFKNVFRDKDVKNIDFDLSDGRIEYEYYRNGIKSGGSITSMSLDECRTFVMLGDAVLDKPEVLESGITIERELFYGDIVEYDVAQCKETIISNVYHRVNTAQREIFDKCFKNILQDKIITDDYDLKENSETGNTFEVKTYYINDIERGDSEWVPASTVSSVSDNISNKKQLIYGNIMPEGNYYNPHTKIQLKSESDEIMESPAKIINYGDNDFSIIAEGEGDVRIKYPTNFGFYKGDFIAFFNINKNNIKWGEILRVDNNNRTLDIKFDINETLNLNDYTGSTRLYYAFWSTNNVPLYANLLPETKKFVWKKLIPQSQLRSNNPLYDLTFSNGRLYIEKNINFFLRRQDPFGKYGLSIPFYKKIIKEFTNPMDNFIIKGNKQADFTGLLYSLNNFDNCY